MRLPRLTLLILLYCSFASAQSSDLKFLRSLSGPNGKVEGNRFVFDESRTKFVYPQDKSLIVYFEWDAPAGSHVLSGIWKGPDGRPVSLSKEINLETPNRELRAFWQFQLVAGMAGGIWSLEVRVDGQPAGSHVFEITMPEPVAPAVTNVQPVGATAPPPQPTLDEVYRRTLASMVWVHRIGRMGRRIDLGSGFVVGKDMVLTAFQNVDAAEELEIEFTDGRLVRTIELTAANRLQDWAVVQVDTRDIPPLEREPSDATLVGARLIVLNAENNKTRGIGGVDISGRQDMPGFPGRIQINPSLNPEAAGGPLLSLYGRVVGVLGGSLTPGARYERQVTTIAIGSIGIYSVVRAATPIKLVGNESTPTSLRTLLTTGILTAPISPLPNFSYGGTTNNVPRDALAATGPNVTDFSHRDPFVWVYTWWQKKDKAGKGMISANVYDSLNRVRIKTAPAKASLQEGSPTRFAFSFSPAKLERGTYRVDILWEDQIAWRTFFTMID
jgi:S1-C subfamily serine protease